MVGKIKAEPLLQKTLKKLFKELKLKNSFVDLNLVSDLEMNRIKINLESRPDFKGREARKIKQEKNVSVLAFPATDFPSMSGKKPLGEIYINYDFTGGNEDSMTYLLIHGLLHLLGYEHHKKRDRMDMEKREKELFIAVSA